MSSPVRASAAALRRPAGLLRAYLALTKPRVIELLLVTTVPAMLLAYRFQGDKFCTAQRFAAYREALGDRFVGRELPDAAANREVPPFFAQHVTTPHSVVTVHLIDGEGQPTVAARDEILDFFRTRLATPGEVSPS